LGNTFIAEKELKPPNKEVPPQVDAPLWIFIFVHKCWNDFLLIIFLQI